MSDDTPSTGRRDLICGSVLVVLGIALCLVIHLHPEQLRAPAWVAYSAATAFLLAGLVLLAGVANATRIRNWLAVPLVSALTLPGIWIAFGKGARQCTISVPGLRFASSETLCRSAFGVGALIGVSVLVLYVAHAVRRQRGS